MGHPVADLHGNIYPAFSSEVKIPETFECIGPQDGPDSSCNEQKKWHDAVLSQYVPIGPRNKPKDVTDMCAFGPQAEFCEGNLGVRRHNMPQMPEDFTPLLETLSSKYKIGHTKIEEMSLKSLKPSQNEVNAGKANGIAGAIKSGIPLQGYIFISNDGYVIDGHHRFFAYKIAEKPTIAAIQLHASIDKILQILSYETGRKGTLDLADGAWGHLVPNGGSRYKLSKKTNTQNIKKNRKIYKSINKSVNRY